MATITANGVNSSQLGRISVAAPPAVPTPAQSNHELQPRRASAVSAGSRLPAAGFGPKGELQNHQQAEWRFAEHASPERDEARIERGDPAGPQCRAGIEQNAGPPHHAGHRRAPQQAPSPRPQIGPMVGPVTLNMPANSSG